jgi:hypothetical protein
LKLIAFFSQQAKSSYVKTPVGIALS